MTSGRRKIIKRSFALVHDRVGRWAGMCAGDHAWSINPLFLPLEQLFRGHQLE